MEGLEELANCQLCAHRCKVNRLVGEKGVCALGLPQVGSFMLHPAPPESFTIFMRGCNFKCLGCQNWSISQIQDDHPSTENFLAPEVLAQKGLKQLHSRCCTQ